MEHAYQLNKIIYRYRDTVALDLDKVSIVPQKITALAGPNGSGKSTLLNLLAFLSSPDQGEIQFFGESVTRNRLLEFRKRVGFLPQKPYMLRGTVSDNIQLALKLHGASGSIRLKRSAEVMRQLDIVHLAEQQAKSLSGGELQRAALARTLSLDPEILILDEPFSYLDQQGTRLMEGFIAEYTQKSGKTLVFSTHNRFKGLALADHIISLVKGKSVKTPLINFYSGCIKNKIFLTHKISIQLPDNVPGGNHVSIDPREIVVSKQALSSSMRNHFEGRIVNIAEESGNVRIGIQAGEIFHALITHDALRELDLHLGDSAWVNFKSNSVVVF